MRKYTQEQMLFVRKKIHGRSYAKMAELFNEHYGLSLTFEQMKSLLTRHGFRNGLRSNNLPKKKYLTQHIQFLKRNVSGRSCAELTCLFNKKFGMSATDVQIRGTLKRYGLRTGRDTRFKKGCIPHTKGKKGVRSGEATWFRPGLMPWNYMPIGTERINSMGYVEIKIANPNIWQRKHFVLWEKVNGPVPKGHVIIFADKNRFNISIDNLLMVSRAELSTMNRCGLTSSHKTLTNAGIAIANLKMLINKRRKTVCNRGTA